jgi:predicted nuclease with TOPRIM domain
MTAQEKADLLQEVGRLRKRMNEFQDQVHWLRKDIAMLEEVIRRAPEQPQQLS